MKTAISTNISLNPGNYARYGHFTTENERNSSGYGGRVVIFASRNFQCFIQGLRLQLLLSDKI